MKVSPFTVALVAVVSALATVGTLELLRSRPITQPALAVETPSGTPAARASSEVGPSAPKARTPDPPSADTQYGDRLAKLERRIAALELGSTRRAPVTSGSDELPPEDDLRDLVLDWVAEEREAHGRAAELSEEEKRRQELEYGARHQALMLAQEHDLEQWQQDEFADLFLKIGVRAEEIERSIDLETADPEEVEARWTEYDEWVDQLERELTARLSPDLYDEIYGDD